MNCRHMPPEVISSGKSPSLLARELTVLEWTPEMLRSLRNLWMTRLKMTPEVLFVSKAFPGARGVVALEGRCMTFGVGTVQISK